MVFKFWSSKNIDMIRAWKVRNFFDIITRNLNYFYLFIYLFIYLLIYLFIHLFVYLFAHLFIYLFIYLFIDWREKCQPLPQNSCFIYMKHLRLKRLSLPKKNNNKTSQNCLTFLFKNCFRRFSFGIEHNLNSIEHIHSNAKLSFCPDEAR